MATPAEEILEEIPYKEPKKRGYWNAARVFRVNGIPPQAEAYQVETAIAHAYHQGIARDRGSSRSQQDRAMNFTLELKHDDRQTGRLQSRGVLKLPQWGSLFIDYIAAHPVKVRYHPIWGDPGLDEATLSFNEAHDIRFQSKEIKRLTATPWQDPILKKQHKERVERLQLRPMLFEIQFGFHHYAPPPKPDEFCVEWSRRFVSSECYLEFLDAIHTFQFHLGDHTDKPHEYIKVRYENVKDITFERGFRPTYTFYLWNAPILERGPQMPDDNNRRERLSGLDEAHERVISYYPNTIRAVLYDDQESNDFGAMAEVIGLKIRKVNVIESYKSEWLTETKTRKITHQWLKNVPFQVAYQVAAWLQNGTFNPREIDSLRPALDRLLKSKKQSVERVVELLSQISGSTWDRRSAAIEEKFAEFCKESEKRKDVLSKSLKSGWFWCHKATITPTTLRLEGPLPEQSNSIIREYSYASHCFLRVTFMDEERMQMRWDKDVDGEGFVAKRIGGVLAKGIEIAGKLFSFLGYSNSGLREHTVWFVTPFQDSTGNTITAGIIRSRIGDFSNTKSGLEYQPAKLGARLAQAFSATEPSVIMEPNEVEEIEDIKIPRIPKEAPTDDPPVKTGHDKTEEIEYIESPRIGKAVPVIKALVNGEVEEKKDTEAPQTTPPVEYHEFTDGYGNISPDLADEIWLTLHGGVPTLPSPAPRAYQVRIGGAKGVVGIDYTLSGRKLVLRDSMVKFKSDNFHLHIAVRFDHPLPLFLNRPLVTALEHLGFPISWFVSLQEAARNRARKIERKIDKDTVEFFRLNRLGTSYGFQNTLRVLVEQGITSKQLEKTYHPQQEFFTRLIETSLVHIDRELKYRARIPVPDGFSLVGIADVHQELKADEVYICVEKPEEGREWLFGSMLITRSPSVHPGDVQRFKAVKPPSDSIYARNPMVNCLVFSVKGDRPPANKLSGGDLDGDLFQIIPENVPFKVQIEDPDEYPPVTALKLNRQAEIEDIQDFVVNFINSDRMGLIGTKHLVVADQSRHGPLEPACRKLARLYSQAVDFAKSGVPVNYKDIPGRLFDLNPDFCRKEASLQDQTDYYESHKALGVLFRAINITPLKPRDYKRDPREVSPMNHPISQLLVKLLADHPLPPGMAQKETENVQTAFFEYARELKTIKRVYTIGRQPLSEEEAFIGTILEPTPRSNRRDDLSYRLREVTGHLVDRVRAHLQGYQDEDPDKKKWLARSCRGWQYSLDKNVPLLKNKDVNPEWRDAQCSFGWIALGSAFECLDVLSGRKKDLRRVRETDIVESIRTN